MIKHVCRILCFILFFNFFILNFGVEVKKASAAEINSINVINYDLKVVDNYLVFDFNKYLSNGDTIEEFILRNDKDTKNNISVTNDSNKRSWKTRNVFLHGNAYTINAKARIGGQDKHLVYNFVYEDYDTDFKPIMAIKGNNVEVDLKSNWLSKFKQDIEVKVDILATNESIVIPEISKTVKQIKDNSSKVIFENKKSSLEPGGYIVRAKIAGINYLSKFYYNGTHTKNLYIELVSGNENKNANNFNIKIKPDTTSGEFNLYCGGTKVVGVKENNLFKFDNVQLRLDSYYHVRLESNDPRESLIGFVQIPKFNKLNCKIIEANSNSLNVKLENIDRLSSHDLANRTIAIYELNQYQKGSEIGKKTGNLDLSATHTINLNSGVKLSKDKSYLVEVTDGNKKMSNPFIYVTMNTSNSEVTETTAKINWTYPAGYSPVSSDKVDIYLRDVDNSVEYKSIPNASLVHNGSSVNLANKTSEVIGNLAPGTNYEAKVVLNNQRGNIVSFTSFTTKPFTLKDYIGVKDTFYDTSSYWKVSRHRSRNLTIEWDFEPENMEFSNSDKVEIFIKPNGSHEFSGYPEGEKYNNPVFTRTSNLNNTKSAEITIPSWLDHYHVDLIYTIGGRKIINRKPDNVQGEEAYNRKTVQVNVNKPNIKVEDIKQTSAKLKWEYDRNFNPEGTVVRYVPENGHIIKAHIKKVSSMGDVSTNFNNDNSTELFHYTHGNNGINLLEKTEFDINNLEPGQFYRVQLIHILQSPGFDDNYRSVSDYYNFQTGSFRITDLKASQESQKPVVDLSWNTEGEITFAEGDKINIYLKEGSTSEYSDEATKSFTLNPDGNFEENLNNNSSTRTESETSPTTQEGKYKIKLDIPKYNTPYNIKVEYIIKGKKINEFVQAEVNGEISLKVSEINPGDLNNGSVKVDWVYPIGYEDSKNGREDKIKLTLIQKEELGDQEGESINLPNEGIYQVSEKTSTITGLKANKYYYLTLTFENDKTDVYSVTTNFKATSELQVVSVIANDIKSKTATISWDYSPQSKELSDNQSKIELWIRDVTENNIGKSLNGGYTKIVDILNKSDSEDAPPGEVDYKMIIKQKNITTNNLNNDNFKKFKSIKLKGLDTNREYSLYVNYDKMNSSEKANSSVVFKTKVDTFKASVFTSDQTKATFGWEYPPGYEIQANDEVRIYIKDVTDEMKLKTNENYGEALLTLKHEGNTNLNEINRVDVSGLTPEKKYKAKIEFQMVGDEQPISTEVDISTKSFSIKSFEVDSYQEYDILVNWSVEPEGMKFNDADKVEIFVKLATAENYPQEPSYIVQGHGEKEGDPDIDTTFSDYVLAETIGEEQKMKLKYTVGDKTYEEELTFTNTINPIKASVFSSDATRALIQVEAPDNYEFVSGDKLLIYAKDEFAEGNVEDEAFLVFEGIQSDSLSIPDDMRLIELSYLLPEATYEVLVKLDLQDGKADPAKLEFKTGAFNVTDLTLESIKHNSNIISWNYGDKEIDFYKDESKYEHTDKLIIAHKESSLGPIAEDLASIKQLTHKEILGQDIRSVKDFNVEVEDPSKDYEVIVYYQLGGLDYIKKFKTSNLYVSSNEEAVQNDKASINWKYPTNVQLGDADKTEIFIRKKNDAEYPSAPSNSLTGTGTTSYTFSGLEGETEYVAKVQVTKQGLNIDPVEVEFRTKAGVSNDVVIENVDYQIQGTAAEFAIPNAENLEIDKDSPIELSMGDEAYKGFTATLNEQGTAFVIKPTIPKKKYENIEIQIPLKDGKMMQITIKEFVTEPENITQDWLSNAYWFAFERFPDEEGYNYWYEHRMLTKKLNGEYFLKNLMFAEDEFTNRNLADKDLIAALYQIVVNREFDEEGLNFWISIYNENLNNAQGNKKLAQETLVDRMVHEPEFGKLCDKAGIFWRQSDQDAAGVVA